MTLNQTRLIEKLTDFLNGEGVFAGLGLKALPASYCWPKTKDGRERPININRLNGNIELPKDETNYTHNIHLKENLNEHWNDLDSAELATWIVNDWGGIRGNKPETLARYMSWVERGYPDEVFSGVASYSKLFAFSAPDEYAIYDQRVAVSLNTLQLLHQQSGGVAFNTPLGRNKVVGDATKRRGFSYI